MLKPEAARKQLEQWTIDGESDGEERVERLVAMAAKLPAKQRGAAYALLDRDAKGQEPTESWEERTKRRRESGTAIDAFSAKDRVKFFQAFFPKMGENVEQAWQLLQRAPFQTGYMRRSFRAPSRPSATLELRTSWLSTLLEFAAKYQPDILTAPWLAAWAPYLEGNYGQPQENDLGRLFAGVIDAGDKTADEVFEVLSDSAKNQHEIGRMGRHVTRALLLASRPEGWELVEKMLLAAQRQEGLRQVILETVDEAHPEAFRRMLRVIRDNDLARFSAVTRALDVWVGLRWDSQSVKVVNDSIDRLLTFADDPSARKKALAGKEVEPAFFALWSIAFDDATQSIPEAEKLLAHKDPEMRYAAVLHLSQVGLNAAAAARLKALEDEDLRVALCALSGSSHEDEEDIPSGESGEETKALELGNDHFEKLEKLYHRMPEKKKELEPFAVWPWTSMTADRAQIASHLINALGKRPPTRLIPYLSAIHPYYRSNVIEQLAKQKKWDALTRDTLFELAGDGSADIRKAAINALGTTTLQKGEAERVEKLLTRKSGDLRTGVVDLLLKQKDPEALESADRLTASKDGNQRTAGLELLRHLASTRRSRSECQARAESYKSSRKKLTRDEETHLAAIAESEQEQLTLDNALGLMDPSQRTPVTPPKKKSVQFVTPAALKCLKALDDLIHQHREEPITVRGEDQQQELLGTIRWGFPSPDWQKPREGQVADLPLAEVWEGWFSGRPAALRDKDGLELLRARLFWEFIDDWNMEEWSKWVKKSPARKEIGKTATAGETKPKLRYERIVIEVLEWLLFLHEEQKGIDWGLDAMETAFAMVPAADMKELAKPAKPRRNRYSYSDDDEESNDWRNEHWFEFWPDNFHKIVLLSGKMTSEQTVRQWNLLHWRDQPFAGARRMRPDSSLLLDAYHHKAANDSDLLDDLIGPEHVSRWGSTDFSLLGELTERKPRWSAEFVKNHPEAVTLANQCRDRILDIELARGDKATAASSPANAISALPGSDTLVRIVSVLGKHPFKTVASWRSDDGANRDVALTGLAAKTFPRAHETLDDFVANVRAAVKEGRIPEERVLQLAFLAPQWTKHVEKYLDWAGFSEGLYWFMAHMRGWNMSRDEAAESAGFSDNESEGEGGEDKQEKKSGWERLVAERTPLTDEERSDGAIDVAWFRRTYEQLSPKRWQAMAEAARFAANSSQAKRAQYVADVLLGKASRKELIANIRTKKLKEQVRLLGLFPIDAGAKRDADLAERYKVLQEYKKYARGLSSMSKPGALRAIEIGMQNLASTAGYPDANRLEWAMEAEAVRDLAAGPVSVTKDGVTVTLSLDEQARPEVTVMRGDKPLKSVPPAVKKDKKVSALTERVSELKKQSSRMRQSLETMMCRGDVFTGAELAQLAGHAILAPLLERLVLVGDGILGYPDKKGKALRDHNGKLEPVKKNESLRVAHPTDLFEAGSWDKWQHECFTNERLQPFKQVFRELYVVTKQEKKDGKASRRYAGQQVNPSQAKALWGSRGWNTQDDVFKMFFDLGLIASVGFNYGITTPLEVEGLTIETVAFHRRDDYKPVLLKDVPARVFSEVMRDMDLVVSVAHRGGVDPEASASTVEMRASLLRETCQLLGLENVRVKNSHALIDGELSNYSIHLGSATVHRMPGGHLCLVPVHAQHRGRLFLPFADDDPKTAEVLSKVILLARDQEIQDPTILDQLRA